MKIPSIATILIAALIGIWIADMTRDYDDTDDIDNGERSGFMLYTDHLTGCQYLRAGMFGGTVPRWDKAGNHVGCKL